ncbi:MAG: hypothetical protein ACKO5J_07685, partial [Rubrivivax sp.]
MGWLDRFRKRPARADPNSSSPVYPSSNLPSDLERSFQDTPAVQRYRASRASTLDLPRAAPVPPAKGQRLLLGLIGLGVLLLVGVLVAGLAASSRHAARLTVAGQAQVQAERLAQAALASEAVPAALAGLKDSLAALKRHVGELREEPAAPVADLGGLLPNGLAEVLAPVEPLLGRVDKQAGVLLAQQAGAARAQDAARNVGRTGSELVLLAEALSVSRVQAGAPPQEVSTLGSVLALAQQISRSALEVAAGAAPQDTARRGAQDLETLRTALKQLADLDAARPAARRDPNLEDKIAGLVAKAEEVGSQFGALAGSAAALGATREARRQLLVDVEPLRRALEAVRQRIDDVGGFGHLHLGLLLAALVLALAGGVGLCCRDANPAFVHHAYRHDPEPKLAPC